MKMEYSYLLHLLGAYLRKEAPETREDVDWEELEKLAQIHGVIGILGYMTRMYPICPDEQRQAKLRQLCRKTVAHFTQRLAGAEELLRILEAAGIDHIVMKGYVLRQLYPVPELRSFNDIDLVIRPEDRQRSDELMLSLGFHRHTDWEPVFSYVRGNEMYELHTDFRELKVLKRADCGSCFDDLWKYAAPSGEHGFRFLPEYHFLYVLAHMAKHVYGTGAGIRMYMDAAVFIQHYGRDLDWDWTWTQLRQMRLERFALAVLTAAEQWFGICCPVEYARLPEQTMDPLLEFTMAGGIYGHNNRNEGDIALKCDDKRSGDPRIRKVVEKAFPKAERIQHEYTYLQGRHWLLPVAWTHRMAKNWKVLGTRTKHLIDTDPDEIQKLWKLMGEIGL